MSGIYVRTDNIRDKVRGINNPMFGKTKELHPKYKGGKPKCIDCGKEIWWQSKRCKKCSCSGINSHRLGKVSIRMCGKDNPMYGRTLDKNPNWQGGKSFIPYPLGWNKTFKEQVRYRDSYKCQRCGVSESECSRNLHVHHIDCNKDNLDLENLVSLCISCHSIIHNELRRSRK